jgi:uncharacterized membrane protein
MKRQTKIVAMAAALGLAGPLVALPQMGAAQPMITYQQEAAAHPRIVKAIHDSEGALRELQAAPDDFGGRKAQAIDDLRRAIHSMRRALFFRTHMDDAAIDAARF